MPDSMFSSGWIARLCGAIALTALMACGGGGGGGGDPGSSGWVPGQFLPSDSFKAMCMDPRAGTDLQGTALDEKNFLRSYSNETYLWYDEIVDQDPSLPQFNSPVEYFDVLKTTATTPSGVPKDNFHFTMPTDDWEQLSQSGSSAGYGALWSLIDTTPPDRRAVVAFVEPGSPASATGVDLTRGAEVIRVDGQPIADGDAAVLNAGLFPEDGEVHTFTVRDLGGNIREIEMTAEIVTSIPVHNVDIAASNMGPVGYLLFNDHIATAETRLVEAIDFLDSQNIQELVVDIRYNGGGFLAIASQFAYMIAGDVTLGQTFEEIRFNDKHPTINPVTEENLEPMLFINETIGYSEPAGNPLPKLDLLRVFVLTGPGTCSASESIMNGLRGIDVEVIQIGSTTCGKPYGFYPTDNCGTTYFTIQFKGVNAKNFGEYSDGFSPDGFPPEGSASGTPVPGCAVADDFTHELGDPLEARFAAALNLIEGGACPPPTGIAAPGMSKPGAPLSATDGITPKSPWRENRILRR